ncbi:DUF6879 family protein [Embleya sp. AB8]|uniref:DUF6879 family protein n=1 Tax=Embleya sp. AB8 TaxID=3156304 RepID=UPI003C70A4F8
MSEHVALTRLTGTGSGDGDDECGQGDCPNVYEDSWTALIRRHQASGGNIGRVHIVTRPLSAYLPFEFARCYRYQAQVGEDIRILDVTDRDNPLPSAHDFWMFDRSTVVLMNYAADGTQLNRELYEVDPASFVECRRIAVAESVPFAEYVEG